MECEGDKLCLLMPNLWDSSSLNFDFVAFLVLKLKVCVVQLECWFGYVYTICETEVLASFFVTLKRLHLLHQILTMMNPL